MANEPAAVTRTYQLILWAVPQVNKYPRDHRFTLGDRTINHLYDLLELLVQASYTRDKKALLERASLEVDLLRHMLRLARDFRVLGLRRHGYGVQLLDDIGRQVGGWRRAGAKGTVKGKPPGKAPTGKAPTGKAP